MDAPTLAKEILNYCQIHANAEIAVKSQRYFKDSMDFHGLMTAQLTSKSKELLASKKITLAVILECLDNYLIKGKYEEFSIGLLILDGFSKEYTKETLIQIEKFFAKGVHNWAHADVLGMYILPKFLLQKNIDISEFKSWMKAPYKFQRRCVPVTFIKAMKKDKDCNKYIKFTEELMNDSEREVHQGMGWFLREAWKIDRKPVETFLEKWKEKAPRLIVQYACEKMTPDEKASYKRSK